MPEVNRISLSEESQIGGGDNIDFIFDIKEVIASNSDTEASFNKISLRLIWEKPSPPW
jgi:hypothetical protein